MGKDQFDSVANYVNDAVYHLRDKASERGLKIGSSHAHSLVAAHLGYKSKIALLAQDSDHSVYDQWLHRERPDLNQIRETISRMRETVLIEKDAQFIANTIQDGLAPPCVETGIRSAKNIPLGDVMPGDETDWVHPSEARDERKFGHCRCCGESVLYRLDELDDEMLCQEHHGEFDLDADEQQDMDDFIEYLTK